MKNRKDLLYIMTYGIQEEDLLSRLKDWRKEP